MLGLTESGVYGQMELPQRLNCRHFIKGGIFGD